MRRERDMRPKNTRGETVRSARVLGSVRTVDAIGSDLRLTNFRMLPLKFRPRSADDGSVSTTYHDDIRQAIQAVRDARGTPKHAEALRVLAILLRRIVNVQ